MKRRSKSVFPSSLNRLNVFVFSTIFAFFLIAITTVLIAFTPLREYIPGYSSTSLKKQAVNLTFKTDSLQQALSVNGQYIASIKKVLTGDVKTVDFNRDSILEAAQNDVEGINLSPSKRDSILREIVSQEDKYNPLTANEEVNFVLFPPVKGSISENYNPETKHFAVDIVTTKDSPVKAVADGTVIFADWTTDSGNVIVLIHTNNLISIYKHNASLHKRAGRVGESWRGYCHGWKQRRTNNRSPFAFRTLERWLPY